MSRSDKVPLISIFIIIIIIIIIITIIIILRSVSVLPSKTSLMTWFQ